VVAVANMEHVRPVLPRLVNSALRPLRHRPVCSLGAFREREAITAGPVASTERVSANDPFLPRALSCRRLRHTIKHRTAGGPCGTSRVRADEPRHECVASRVLRPSEFPAASGLSRRSGQRIRARWAVLVEWPPTSHACGGLLAVDFFRYVDWDEVSAKHTKQVGDEN